MVGIIGLKIKIIRDFKEINWSRSGTEKIEIMEGATLTMKTPEIGGAAVIILNLKRIVNCKNRFRLIVIRVKVSCTMIIRVIRKTLGIRRIKWRLVIKS